MSKAKPPVPDGGYLLPQIAKRLRERAAVRPSELARRIGVSPSAVNQFEDPSSALTEGTLRQYADALGVPFADALREGLEILRKQGVHHEEPIRNEHMTSTNNIPGLIVIIFGSAAKRHLLGPSAADPRDIDVAYGVGRDYSAGGDARKDADRIARAWAHENGFGHLLLDMHNVPVIEHNLCETMTLPTPFDTSVYAAVIVGQVKILWRSCTGLASAVRAFGQEPKRLRQVLEAGQFSANSPGVWELSLRRAHDTTFPWDETYCDGLDALRSALQHAAPGAWEAATEEMLWARFVNALLLRGPSAEGIAYAARRSSGGGARLFLGPNGVRTQYGGEGYLSSKTAEDLFTQPPVLLLNTSIVTTPGRYELSESITPEVAREVVKGGFVSAIGHEAAAQALSVILGQEVAVNRVLSFQKIGQKALVLKVRGRLPEGVVLDAAALVDIGYDLLLLTREA